MSTLSRQANRGSDRLIKGTFFGQCILVLTFKMVAGLRQPANFVKLQVRSILHETYVEALQVSIFFIQWRTRTYRIYNFDIFYIVITSLSSILS